MKKIILSVFFLLAFCLSILKAQPTITSASMYAVGDELIMQSADTIGINEGPAGANQTWDFSDLQAAGAPVIESIINPGTTPYASDYPTADLAIDAGGGDGYSYLDASGNDVFELGFGSSQALIVYSDPQKFISYPITYNSSFNDAMAGSWEINGFTNERTGSVSFLADGYGSIMLPTGGTINNVLRMKYVQNFTDVVTILGNDFTTTTVSTTYFWMVPGNKNSLVSISYITVTSQLSTINLKTVSYYPGSVSANDLLAVNANLQIFPNPANSKSSIRINLDKAGLARLSLYNIYGAEVKVLDDSNVPAGLYSHEIDLEDLTDGIYFIKMDLDNQKLFSRNIVKQ